MKYSKLSNKWYLFRSKAIEAFRAVFAWRHSWVFFGINLFLVTCLVVGSFEIFSNFKEDILVLHYNIDFGVDWIGSKSLIFWLAETGAALFLLDLLVLLLVFKNRRFRFLSFFIWGGVTACELFLLAALFSVYLVNFR
ncbi:MAG: hypothetical protein ACOYMB_00730 [Patescibacteria group bacterium]